ncbi:hypothetical protein ACRAWD_30895 [Caulobacter segnis]
MLTARDAVRDRIAGLDMGADECVLQLFDPFELVGLGARGGAAQGVADAAQDGACGHWPAIGRPGLGLVGEAPATPWTYARASGPP